MRALISKVLTGSMIASANRSLGAIERDAKRLFDQMPHRHPAGHIPDWDIQPREVKNVFRKKVSLGYHLSL